MITHDVVAGTATFDILGTIDSENLIVNLAMNPVTQALYGVMRDKGDSTDPTDNYDRLIDLNYSSPVTIGTTDYINFTYVGDGTEAGANILRTDGTHAQIIGMDFGIHVQTKSGSKIGLMIQDLNSRYQWKTDKIYEKGKLYIDQFPTLVRLGTNLNYKNFYIVGDAGLIMNQQEIIGYTFRAGMEYPYLDNYYLRAGFGNRRMSVGVGLDWSLLKDGDGRLDYAFVFESPAGGAHVFTYAFSF